MKTSPEITAKAHKLLEELDANVGYDVLRLHVAETALSRAPWTRKQVCALLGGIFIAVAFGLACWWVLDKF